MLHNPRWPYPALHRSKRVPAGGMPDWSLSYSVDGAFAMAGETIYHRWAQYPFGNATSHAIPAGPCSPLVRLYT